MGVATRKSGKYPMKNIPPTRLPRLWCPRTAGIQPRRSVGKSTGTGYDSSSDRKACRIKSEMGMSRFAASTRTFSCKSGSTRVVMARFSDCSVAAILFGDAPHRFYFVGDEVLKQSNTYASPVKTRERMASNQGESDGEMPRVTASIPGNKKTALDYMAQDRSNPGDRTYVSELVRESVTEYLSSHWDELPEEAKDLLDDDLEANAGGDGD